MRIEDSLLATLCGALLLALLFTGGPGPADSRYTPTEPIPPAAQVETCPKELSHANR